MQTKIQRWGNSQGVRFPKTILKEVDINIGDDVTITVSAGKIVIEAVNKVRGRYDIRDLVAQMPTDYQVEEVNWGSPEGGEVW